METEQQSRVIGMCKWFHLLWSLTALSQVFLWTPNSSYANLWADQLNEFCVKSRSGHEWWRPNSISVYFSINQKVNAISLNVRWHNSPLVTTARPMFATIVVWYWIRGQAAWAFYVANHYVIFRFRNWHPSFIAYLRRRNLIHDGNHDVTTQRLWRHQRTSLSNPCWGLQDSIRTEKMLQRIHYIEAAWWLCVVQACDCPLHPLATGQSGYWPPRWPVERAIEMTIRWQFQRQSQRAGESLLIAPGQNCRF